jgi:outer membrane protein assembly factor BamB
MPRLLPLWLLTLPALAHADDWPRFLGPQGNSVSTEKGLLSPWPKEGPKILWHRPIGIGYSMPVVEGDKLYHFDRHRNYARVTCMSVADGSEVWNYEYPTSYRDKYNYNGGPRCCPVIDGDRLFCHGVEGMLVCLNKKNGDVVWKIDTVKEFGIVQNFFGVGSTPVVEGDLLIVSIGGSPPGSDREEDFLKLKGNGTGVVAFEKATGKIRYKISDELASYASPHLATIDGRRWCFVFARGGLLAFEPASGKIDFHFPWRSDLLESVNASNPVVVGNKVFVSETYGPGSALLEVKPGGYKVLWTDAEKGVRNKSMQLHWNTAIHHEGHLYGSSGRHESNAELRCIELATGKVKWSVPNLTRASLLMVDGHFICLSENGYLQLLKVNAEKFDRVSDVVLKDPKTGEALLAEPCWAAPILSNGRLFLRGDGRLVCLEAMRVK